MSATADLTLAARAADPACVGCALLDAGDSRPGWLIAERADGLRVRIDGVAPGSPAVAAVLALDLGDEATRARAAQRLAAAAVMDTLGRAAVDPFAAAVVALFDVAFTLVNDERELRGAPRLTSAEIFPLAIDALLARQNPAPASPPPPAPPPMAPPPP